ncbi:MAG TPA: O-antigen ligase family protein, partial [Terriglobales bacterium]|nr:O-antigen ligase family protein [Terriglobales bacterium]
LALLVGLFCIWDVMFDRWILHSDVLFSDAYTHNRRVGRFGSIFLNPNVLGAFVVLVFPQLFILSLTERQRLVRLYLVIAMLGLVFCLVETQSRGPILAFGGALTLLVLGPVRGMSRTRRVAGMLAFIAALAVLMPGFFEHSATRFRDQGYDESAEVLGRASVWEYTQRLIFDHPLGGVGFGEQQFLRAMSATDFLERYGEHSLDNPHNSYLTAAVFAGIPALLVFLVFNAALLAKAFARSWQTTPDDPWGNAVFGLAVCTAGFLICMYPDMHLFTPNIAPTYWLSCGILMSMLSLSKGTSEARMRRPEAMTTYGLRVPTPTVGTQTDSTSRTTRAANTAP